MRSCRNLLCGILKVNAGGTRFETAASTLTKRFPKTPLAALVNQHFMNPAAAAAATTATGETAAEPKSLKKKVAKASAPLQQAAVQSDRELFLDVDPDVFKYVLNFLRTGSISLPVNDEALRSSVVYQLKVWGLLDKAFPAQEVQNEGRNIDPTDPEGEKYLVRLPDVCVVQLCDHMSHDQGVKKHAMTITFGADGFQLRSMCKAIRKDLKTQLSNTFWQCHQTNERAAFFVSNKVANASADLLITSVTQRVVEHTEKMGYSLQSSYVTLSPDVVHTNVRMFIHNFIFRRVREPVLEESDGLVLVEEGGGKGSEELTYKNFEAPHLGPKAGFEAGPTVIPPGQKVRKIWD